MKYCKNCGEEISENRVYCSLACRNIFVNKNLRDYKKISDKLKEHYIEEYVKNPNFCKNCGKIIPYDLRNNLYCCKECINYNPNRKGILMNFTKKGLKSLRNSNKRRDYEKKKEYYSHIKRCPNCNKMIPFIHRNYTFCDIKCRAEYNNNQRSEYQNYRIKCRFSFNLDDFPDEFDFELIRLYGWYRAKNKGNNIDGISRDHMLSIKDGYLNKIDSYIISHPANCRLIRNTENQVKNSKSSITFEELLIRIEEWNRKYKKN